MLLVSAFSDERDPASAELVERAVELARRVGDARLESSRPRPADRRPARSRRDGERRGHRPAPPRAAHTPGPRGRDGVGVHRRAPHGAAGVPGRRRPRGRPPLRPAAARAALLPRGGPPGRHLAAHHGGPGRRLRRGGRAGQPVPAGMDRGRPARRCAASPSPPPRRPWSTASAATTRRAANGSTSSPRCGGRRRRCVGHTPRTSSSSTGWWRCTGASSTTRWPGWPTLRSRSGTGHDGAWRQWYAAVWAEAAVLAELADRRDRLVRARFIVGHNPVASAIVDRAEAIDAGDTRPAPGRRRRPRRRRVPVPAGPHPCLRRGRGEGRRRVDHGGNRRHTHGHLIAGRGDDPGATRDPPQQGSGFRGLIAVTVVGVAPRVGHMRSSRNSMMLTLTSTARRRRCRDPVK